MPHRIVQFIAIIVTALALVPAGAHLLEMATKMTLDRDQYMTVQGIYRGWAMLGAVLIAGIIVNFAAAAMARGQPAPLALSATAGGLMLATLAIFFVWTFPANQATNNWLTAPEDWRALRAQWEDSHAVNAVLTFLALCAATASALLSRRPVRGG